MIKGKKVLNTCYLQLGSNEGDSLNTLKAAEEFIQQLIGEIVKKSSYYQSEPWGNSNLNWFLNSVIQVRTVLYPFQLLEVTQLIESRLGRESKGGIDGRYANRSIDIDILFYDNFIIRSKQLTIPHDKIPHRRFVLKPFVEIFPQYIHPCLDKNVSYLLDNCQDNLKVVRMD
jgi:2-amino-4-hydroxy-6-hydroxymethyldihydropteridine diphosphokinase